MHTRELLVRNNANFLGHFLCAIFFMVALPNKSLSAPVVKEVRAMKAPVFIADIKAKYPKVLQGHGPYIWMQLEAENKEIWFWYLPSEAVEYEADFEGFPVVLVSIGKIDHENEHVVIWPAKYKKLTLKNAYLKVYGVLGAEQSKK